MLLGDSIVGIGGARIWVDSSILWMRALAPHIWLHTSGRLLAVSPPSDHLSPSLQEKGIIAGVDLAKGLECGSAVTPRLTTKAVRDAEAETGRTKVSAPALYHHHRA